MNEEKSALAKVLVGFVHFKGGQCSSMRTAVFGPTRQLLHYLAGELCRQKLL
jgi:hypothetical protein